MKKKEIIKLIAASLASVVMMGSLFTPSVVSAATSGQAVNVEGIDEISQSQKFSEMINGDSLVYSIKSLKDNTILKFTYDENCNRLTKTYGKDTTYYTYDENNNLVEEKSNKADIKFTINDENTTVGFEYEGNKYTYVFNPSNDSINEIKDEHGETVVKYKYDEKNNAIVLGKDAKGQWIDKSNDDSFIGNINPYRFAGFYFDKETGYYYYGGCYYNAETQNYYLENKISRNIYSIDTESLVSKEYSLESASRQSISKSDIDKQAQSLIKNKKVGNPVNNTSSTWYSQLSTIDILARLIYAENTSNLTDQKAISWVLVNRYNANKSYLGGKNLRDIATKKGQFSTINGAVKNARCPNTSSKGWSNAVWLACAINKTQNRTNYAKLTPKPKGIDKQCSFWGISYFASKMRASGGKLYVNNKALKNVAIAGVAGNITKTKIINSNKNKSYNVFFDYESENLL